MHCLILLMHLIFLRIISYMCFPALLSCLYLVKFFFCAKYFLFLTRVVDSPQILFHFPSYMVCRSQVYGDYGVLIHSHIECMSTSRSQMLPHEG
jgi:hypothetical protein